MTRAAQDKPYVNFSRGLITEATGLTYPDNSVQEIDNCDINIDGSVQRRLGLDLELGGTSIELVEPMDSSSAVSTFNWDNVDNNPSLNFLVLQVGLYIYFFKRDALTASLNQLRDSAGNIIFMRLGEGESKPINLSQTNKVIFGTDQFYSFVPGFSVSQVKLEPLSFRSSGFSLYITGAGLKRPVLFVYSEDLNGYGSTELTQRAAPYIGTQKRVPFNQIFPGIYIRDFDGVRENLTSTGRVEDAITVSRLYNLLNQGWTPAQINQTFTTLQRYPTNSEQAQFGKDSNDNYDPNLLAKQNFGTGLAPKGSGFLNLFDGSRRFIFTPETVGFKIFADIPFSVQQIDSLGNTFGVRATIAQGTFFIASAPTHFYEVLIESQNNSGQMTKGFTASEFFAGRYWVGGAALSGNPETVYFSKIVTNSPASIFFSNDEVKFFQDGDPTSETTPDLLDSDGGVIPIPKAKRIKRLEGFKIGVLVFAENGLTFIRGSDSGFKATDFSVDDVSSAGMLSESSFVKTEDDSLYYFSTTGIQLIRFNGAVPENKDITEETISSLYMDIPIVCKEFAKGVYDKKSKKIYWLYSSDALSPLSYDKSLILDLRTGAFSQYTLPKILDDSLYIVGIYEAVPPRVFTVQDNVVSILGDQVISLADGDVIVGEDFSEAYEDVRQEIKLILRYGDDLFITAFVDEEFIDLANIYPGAGIDYSSYLLTFPENLGDLQRYKQATYVHSFFKKTETVFVTDGVDVVPANQSGCILTGVWDWHTNNNGKRFSQPQQAYRFRKKIPPVLGEPVDNGEGIIYTKLKVRGKGRSLALKYESDGQKNFILVGVSSSMTANGV